MSARTKARKRALDLLYAAQLRGRPALEELAEHREQQGTEGNPYTAQLVAGIADHANRIDEVISTYAEGWTLERMPAVDLNLLRLGSFEILYVEDVPDAVAISEAVKLARDLSTDDSPAFVNGVLGNLARDKAALLTEDD
ncbi:transcription antitermination factor NusB [Nocardioides terrisoli]|uniref:transcription antitermination factor NusB n=1 Tax=Nocardioides terrisoli TaxID=3388267 RepID=UPI00287B926E|nr:transcription antitermination factor NusB [Nocardioides marmorisolisilvae]